MPEPAQRDQPQCGHGFRRRRRPTSAAAAAAVRHLVGTAEAVMISGRMSGDDSGLCQDVGGSHHFGKCNLQ